MKKLLFIIQLAALIAVYSSPTYASGGHGKGRALGHYKHKHKHRPVVIEKHYYHEEVRHYPQPEVRYHPAPPPPPQYSRPVDQRSTQGLVGGALGSALGYEMGKGDPVASGLGAAAGAYIGNGMSGR
ncbi:MAG: hypothetical protein M8364_12350 [Methylobacter sp.]|uniref:hypothetical protein n=1 Tax=Methylobacter sp. TaxID=2051955 RepID=UPI00258AF5DD|nr:hypothetical protein [Methylobacter sp.]MCL7421684.1 hypothetical protein [Methylobacter sp.]